MTLVKIKKVPLGQLFAAAYGALRVETTGVIGGRVIRNNGHSVYIAEVAHASQLAYRQPSTVSPDFAEENRVGKFFNVIGGFHSHINSRKSRSKYSFRDKAGVWMSDSDYDYISGNYPQGIEIVIALAPAMRITPLLVAPHHVSGIFTDRGRHYRVQMGAYYIDHHARKRRAFLDIAARDLARYLE
ncbi:MAG TPA: hypothetical protein VJK03_04345 [Candidatus Nanoarchaeia archaeon]|nr:hypothetical protein [Candidatus Nanoarchaeia archaeon]